MARKLTAWNKHVQKTFKAGKANDANYSFKQALQDASQSHTGGNEELAPAHNNNIDTTENKADPLLQNGGEPVGANVGSTTLSGSPLKGGRRRSKKNKHHKKKGSKSHKKQKHPKHH